MPANTPKGYPYPLGTDRVMDGDDSIHALATAVDKRQAVWGTGTVPLVNTGSAANVAVTFPASSFTVPPTAVMVITTSARLVPASQLITATGFTATLGNWSGTNISTTTPMSWVAFGAETI